jgi:enamine deaminase RidA (YjgF/YER057c/UK114 family)
MQDKTTLRALTPGSVRPPFAAYSHGTHVPAGAEWVFTSGQLGITPDDTIPERRGGAGRSLFRGDRRDPAGGGVRARRHGADQRLRHRPGAYGRLHGRAGPLVRGMARLPASTLVIVAGFTRPEFKVEVEVAAARLPVP